MISILRLTKNVGAAVRKYVFRRPHVKQYYIKNSIPKTLKGEYRPSHWVIPEESDSFTQVCIGKTADPNYEKKITTFYQGDRILSRCVDVNNKPVLSRDYSYCGIYGTYYNDACYRRNIITKTYESGDTFKPTIRAYEDQAVVKFDGDPRTRVIIEKNTIDGDNITGIIKECLPKSLRKKIGNKFLELKMKFVNGILHVEKQSSNGAEFPKDQPLMPFTFLYEPVKKLEALTRFFLARRGLDNMKIDISIFRFSDDTLMGYFSPSQRAIHYNSEKLYNLVDLSAHECEHAYQHSLIGRLGKGTSDYERDCYKVMGDLKDDKLVKEASKYLIAFENYPSDHAKQHFEYWNNLLEVKAREAGKKADEEFENVSSLIRRQFNFGFKG